MENEPIRLHLVHLFFFIIARYNTMVFVGRDDLIPPYTNELEEERVAWQK